MSDNPGPHPPEPPIVPIGSLRQLLDEFPPDWQVSIEDASLLLVFDQCAEPRSSIKLADGRPTRVELPSDESDI